MTIEEAISKFSKYHSVDDIKDAVPVDGAFVFYLYDCMQPIIVNRDGVRGLNGNLHADRSILDKAGKKLLEEL